VQEGSIMEFVKWFITLFMIFLFLAIAVFVIELGSINNFKQQINYQIERNGGLTNEAVDNLNEYSKKNYGQKYEITSDNLYQKVAWGQKVDYTVLAVYKIKFFTAPDVHLKFRGSAVSMIR